MAETKSYGGTGTYHGYHVEVRIKPSSISDSHQVGDTFIVTKEWKRVPTDEVPICGVRNELWEWDFYPHARELRLLRWETANAIAAQVAASHHMHSFLMEFRFVQVEVKHSYSHRAIKAGAAFNFGDKMEAQDWETFAEQKEK